MDLKAGDIAPKSHVKIAVLKEFERAFPDGNLSVSEGAKVELDFGAKEA